MATSAAFFDLDKTILATSASLALTRPLLRAGLMRTRDVMRAAQSQLAYHLLDATHERSERIKDDLTQMVSGWSVAEFDAVVAAALTESIQPVVYREALDAISTHHAAGHDVVIVSASAEAIVRPIMRLLDADGMIATQLEIEDGRYTGGIAHYNYGPAKPLAMEAMADRRGWDLERCWAYSDSITDEPLLRSVGHPVAVNPDRALLRIARDEGWSVRRWEQQVVLNRTGEISLAAAGGVAAAALAVALLLRRRRRQRPRS
ncbi:MAG TPA: HAD family hydrolase [Actinomycetales bacterium]|nr:HAD family hydrolase [Actinomycetales bacterium]